MKKYALLVATALIAAAPAYAEQSAAPISTPAAKSKEDYVIMKIGADDIKRSEIEKVWKVIFPGGNAPDFDTLDPRIKNNLLRGVANEHILLREAKKDTNLAESPEVRDRVRTAENQILIQEFLRVKTKDAVSDEKLKELYDQQMKNRGERPEEVRARHILVKTEADAKALAKKLKKGEDFAAVAKEKSEDKASGASGGDLGWFTADRMTPEFSKAAFALKKGEVSDPVKTDFGWHIIKLEERRTTPAPTFDMLKEDLKNQLTRKVVMDYVNSVMKDQKVTVVDSKGMEKPLPAEPEAVAPIDAVTQPVGR